MKRIIICSDGTWNKPEENLKEDHPTNVLKFARGISPHDNDGVDQVVFYDWGIGSYHDSATGGAFGAGLDKNIKDGYRFLVHNYKKGDHIYLFGFSRGAYTVRSLCGLINNCSILKGSDANRVEEAFAMYKNPAVKPGSSIAANWRKRFSVHNTTKIKFVGVWDTVGAMGLPFSFFGLIKDKQLFYDRHIGKNIEFARHALSLDEKRDDFEPTIWEPRHEVDLKQVWFAGVHSDVGGSYKPDPDGTALSDIPMQWMIRESESKGLAFEPYFTALNTNYKASKHESYSRIFKLMGKSERKIPNPEEIPTSIHKSVKERIEDKSVQYRCKPVEEFIKRYGRWPEITV